VSNEIYALPQLNRVHYAPPDLDLAIITTTTEFGEQVLPVEVVPGAGAIDDRDRYRFFEAPPQAPTVPSAPAEGEDGGTAPADGGR
jgi:hypothetical protein